MVTNYFIYLRFIFVCFVCSWQGRIFSSFDLLIYCRNYHIYSVVQITLITNKTIKQVHNWFYGNKYSGFNWIIIGIVGNKLREDLRVYHLDKPKSKRAQK